MVNSHPAAASVEWVATRQHEDEIYLRKLGVAYTSEGLLRVLNEEKPKSAMPLACHGLANLGAIESIPVLKRLADFPKADVKACSVLAVARLAGKSETAWLLECLSKKGTDKAYVLWALAMVADPAACDAVKGLFEPVLRKLERGLDADPRRVSVLAVAYLEQVAADFPEVSELLERFRVIAPSLDPLTRSSLASTTQMFSHWKRDA
jgi:hypothetical protein